MIDIRSTLCRLGTSYRGTLNDRYKVYTLLIRDFIPGGILNDRLRSTFCRLETSYPGNSE
jgi:hypothetical protein